jgi:hypothetical protein
MSRKTLILVALLLIAIVAAVVGWQKAVQLRAELQSLQAQLEAAQQETASQSDAKAKQEEAKQAQLHAEAQDLLRLRGEVAQLRAGAKDLEKLRAENQQLKSANQQLRTAGAPAATPAAAPSETGKDIFPREAWAFSGYATPEAALVSAISAMKEGNPKTYLDSLAPEEQLRMAKAWENKPEAELAAKHQQDVSAITGMRVLDRKTISPDEVQMSVYVQGVDRIEKVSMKLINNEWKFGGFMRDPKK